MRFSGHASELRANVSSTLLAPEAKHQKRSDHQEHQVARLWSGLYIQRDLLPGAVCDARKVHVKILRVEGNSGCINSRDVGRAVERNGANRSLAHVKEAETIKCRCEGRGVAGHLDGDIDIVEKNVHDWSETREREDGTGIYHVDGPTVNRRKIGIQLPRSNEVACQHIGAHGDSCSADEHYQQRQQFELPWSKSHDG